MCAYFLSDIICTMFTSILYSIFLVFDRPFASYWYKLLFSILLYKTRDEAGRHSIYERANIYAVNMLSSPFESGAPHPSSVIFNKHIFWMTIKSGEDFTSRNYIYWCLILNGISSTGQWLPEELKWWYSLRGCGLHFALQDLLLGGIRMFTKRYYIKNYYFEISVVIDRLPNRQPRCQIRILYRQYLTREGSIN